MTTKRRSLADLQAQRQQARAEAAAEQAKASAEQAMSARAGTTDAKKAVRRPGKTPVVFDSPKGLRDLARTVMEWEHQQDPSRTTVLAEWIQEAVRDYLACSPTVHARRRKQVSEEVQAAVTRGEVGRASYRLNKAVHADMAAFLKKKQKGEPRTMRVLLAEAITFACQRGYAGAAGAVDLEKTYEQGERTVRTKTRAGQTGISFIATRDFMDLARGAYRHALSRPQPPDGLGMWVDHAIARYAGGNRVTMDKLAAADLAAEKQRKARYASDDQAATDPGRPLPRRFRLSESTNALVDEAVAKGRGQGLTRASLALAAVGAEIARARKATGGALEPVGPDEIDTVPSGRGRGGAS